MKISRKVHKKMKNDWKDSLILDKMQIMSIINKKCLLPSLMVKKCLIPLIDPKKIHAPPS